MRILLLNQYFPPDDSATAKMIGPLAERLARRHEVTVLCGRPSYEPREVHRRYLFRRERHGRLTVIRVGSSAFARYGMAGRVANYLTYLGFALPVALTAKADVVLAMTDPPFVGILGALAARVRGLPFVYNVRDLHPDMALASGFVRPGRFTRWWDRVHNVVLRRATKVIVLGLDMRDRVIGKGVKPGRVAIVRDGVPVPKLRPSPDHPVLREIRGDGRFVLIHAGNLGFAGAWDTLLAAGALLNGQDVSITFVGEGAERARLEASANGKGRFRFLPYRPAAEVPFVLAAADAHIVTVRRGLEGLVVPSKLYPILAAGRPVLAVATEESDVARIVREHDCGVVADPDDPAAVAAAIRELAADPDRLAGMGERAAAAAPQFEAEAEMERFVVTLEQVLRDFERVSAKPQRVRERDMAGQIPLDSQ